MKKIAGNKNYQRLKQLLESGTGVRFLRNNDSLDNDAELRLSKKIEELELELAYAAGNLKAIVAAIEDLYKWRNSLPDLELLNYVWSSFNPNDKETLN
jgi:hypothetical protein